MSWLHQLLEKRGDLLCGLFIGAVAGWVVSTAPGWLQASSYKHWWDIATAIGTVATAIVAVAIPFWQNSANRREARRAALSVQWNVSHDAYQAIYRLGKLVDDWKKGGAPNPALLDGDCDQLKLAKARVVGILGNQIIGEAVTIGIELQSERGQESKELRSDIERSWFLVEKAHRLEDLYQNCLRWMEMLHGEADRVGLTLQQRTL